MIALYRKGNTHVIRGVKCEMGRFETKRLQGCLNSGWVTNPQDLLEVEKVVEVVECSSDVAIRLAAPLIEALETVDEVERFCTGDQRKGIKSLAAERIKSINEG